MESIIMKNSTGSFSCPVSDRIEKMSADISEMAFNMNSILERWDNIMGHVMDTMNNRVPEGCVPLKTHTLVVKGIITGFSVVVVVAVGAVKLLPVFIEMLGQ